MMITVTVLYKYSYKCSVIHILSTYMFRKNCCPFCFNCLLSVIVMSCSHFRLLFLLSSYWWSHVRLCCVISPTLLTSLLEWRYLLFKLLFIRALIGLQLEIILSCLNHDWNILISYKYFSINFTCSSMLEQFWMVRVCVLLLDVPGELCISGTDSVCLCCCTWSHGHLDEAVVWAGHIRAYLA